MILDNSEKQSRRVRENMPREPEGSPAARYKAAPLQALAHSEVYEDARTSQQR
jgi:hypothetical protein